MPIYAVEFSKSTRKEVSKLNPQIALRITKAVYKLASDPKKGSVRPMVGSKHWRLRVGDYRVIYDIHDKKLVILVVRVAHRGKVYK